MNKCQVGKTGTLARHLASDGQEGPSYDSDLATGAIVFAARCTEQRRKNPGRLVVRDQAAFFVGADSRSASSSLLTRAAG